MKILLLGATGMIGSRVLAEAVSRGHAVTAGVRNSDKIPASAQLTAVKFDIHAANDLSALAAKSDIVISAISPRNGGPKTEEALSIAATLIAALRDTRLVLVGGAGSLNLPDGTPVAEVVPEAYFPEATAMRAAYERIADSDLDYTVLAPASEIAPGERTGAFRLGENRTLLTDSDGTSRISAEDFAIAVIDEAEQANRKNQIFNVAY